MTRTETRLLVLGAVMIFEPVNAYQLRRELLSWRVEQWANVNPGSIYTALATLTRNGHLRRDDIEDGQRVVAVYRAADAGRDEFDRLFADAVVTIDQSSYLGLYTALSLQGLVTRGTMLDLLARRLAAVEELVAGTQDMRAVLDQMPPHVPAIVRLVGDLAEQERSWLADTIARIERGESHFLGEAAAWRPDADDPGWQIARDRRRYLEKLGLPLDTELGYRQLYPGDIDAPAD